MKALGEKLADIAVIGTVLGVGACLNPPGALAAAVAPILTGVGTNWFGDLSRTGWWHARGRLLGGSGELNHDLQKADCRAFQKTVADLETVWRKTPRGSQMLRTEPVVAESAKGLFERPRDDAERFCTLADVGRAADDAGVRRLLDGDVAAARAELSQRVEEYLAVEQGDDVYPVVEFILAHLTRDLAVRFGEELKAATPEGNRAWRAYQRMLLETILAGVTEVGARQRATEQDIGYVRATLERWERDLRTRPPEQRDPAGWQELEEALTRARDELLDAIAAGNAELRQAIAAGFDEVTRQYEQVLTELAQIAGTLTRIESRLIDAPDLAQIGLERAWVRPSPPRPEPGFVGRGAELAALEKLLTPGARVAITAAVHGMPGVGKTRLAEQPAARLDDQFPGGVLFASFGASFRDPALAGPTITDWALHAFGGPRARDDPRLASLQFTPEAARTLLAPHGPLLVVLDDVWSLSFLEPLRRALPRDACLLITTRNEGLATDLLRGRQESTSRFGQDGLGRTSSGV